MTTALGNILSIPSVKSEHPKLHQQATNELADLLAVVRLADEALGFVEYLAGEIDADKEEKQLAKRLRAALAKVKP